ncbi:MAG: hypothetical protein OEY13_05130 [Gammaproteobacteria bacterium]|nr:hypothetical protein [Gammaproteobacteria bacterium]
MPSRLSIEQLSIDCLLHRDVAADERRARDLLERVLRTTESELPGLLAAALAVEGESDEVIYLREVRFEATVGAQWSADRIARALATSLLRSVWHGLAAPDAVRFRDRPEKLARFLLDLAQGHAFTQDWHARFEGLKLLPGSAIVRTLASDEPAVARAALGRLLPDHLRRIVALLNADDARRVLAAISADAAPSAVSLSTIVDALIEQRRTRLDESRDQLEFVVGMFRKTGTAVDGRVVARARAALAVARELQHSMLTEEQCRDRLESLTQELAAAGEGRVAPADPSVTGASPDGGSVREVLERLRGQLLAADPSGPMFDSTGIWLLLPGVLSRLEPDGSQEEAVTALAALAACAGDDADRVWRDDALREALTLDEDEILAIAQRVRDGRNRRVPAARTTLERRSTRCRDGRRLGSAAKGLGLPPALCRRAVQLGYAAFAAYARRLPGFGDASFGHLWSNFLSVGARVSITAATIDIEIERAPLDVIWRISGADRAAFVLPSGRPVRIGAGR